MHLTFSPQTGLPGQTETAIEVAGDTLIIDGIPYDLSPVPEGGEGVDEDPDSPFIGPIRRIGGVIHATLRVRLGADADNVQPADPAHWVLPAAEGRIIIPATRKQRVSA